MLKVFRRNYETFLQIGFPQIEPFEKIVTTWLMMMHLASYIIYLFSNHKDL